MSCAICKVNSVSNIGGFHVYCVRQNTISSIFKWETMHKTFKNFRFGLYVLEL